MYAIKMEPDRSLTTTIQSTIYQGDKDADTLVFVVPCMYGDVSLADCCLLLRYILPNGVGCSEELNMYPIPHNKDYYQYRLSLSSRFTERPGKIELWLTAIDFDDNVIFHTGTTTLNVRQHIAIEDYMPGDRFDQLDKLALKVAEMEKGRVNNLFYDEENATLQLVADGIPVGDTVDVSQWDEKADNIVFNEEDSTIQLTANGEPIGERIYVCARSGKLIKDMGISSNGNLVVTYDDDTVEKVGRVVGKDGKVYVPHVDEHKILTFTIEDVAGEIPAPTDLNPNDEWSEMQEQASSDYVWDTMGPSM